MLTNLLAWALAHVGATYILTESVIGAPLRLLLTRGLSRTPLVIAISFLYCPGCVGFWLGILAGVFGITTFERPDGLEEFTWGIDERIPWVTRHEAVRVLLTGLAGAGLGALWGSVRGPYITQRLLDEQPSVRAGEDDDDAKAREASEGVRGSDEARGEPLREPEEAGGDAPARLAPGIRRDADATRPAKARARDGSDPALHDPEDREPGA